jgi:hypothetical protein
MSPRTSEIVVALALQLWFDVNVIGPDGQPVRTILPDGGAALELVIVRVIRSSESERLPRGADLRQLVISAGLMRRVASTRVDPSSNT